jgi:hypothetical protein
MGRPDNREVPPIESRAPVLLDFFSERSEEARGRVSSATGAELEEPARIE